MGCKLEDSLTDKAAIEHDQQAMAAGGGWGQAEAMVGRPGRAQVAGGAQATGNGS
jgi:hypothetical protein